MIKDKERFVTRFPLITLAGKLSMALTQLEKSVSINDIENISLSVGK